MKNISVSKLCQQLQVELSKIWNWKELASFASEYADYDNSFTRTKERKWEDDLHKRLNEHLSMVCKKSLRLINEHLSNIDLDEVDLVAVKLLSEQLGLTSKSYSYKNWGNSLPAKLRSKVSDSWVFISAPISMYNSVIVDSVDAIIEQGQKDIERGRTTKWERPRKAKTSQDFNITQSIYLLYLLGFEKLPFMINNDLQDNIDERYKIISNIVGCHEDTVKDYYRNDPAIEKEANKQAVIDYFESKKKGGSKKG